MQQKAIKYELVSSRHWIAVGNQKLVLKREVVFLTDKMVILKRNTVSPTDYTVFKQEVVILKK